MWTLDSAKPFSVYWLSCSRPLRGLTTNDEHLFLGLTPQALRFRLLRRLTLKFLSHSSACATGKLQNKKAR